MLFVAAPVTAQLRAWDANGASPPDGTFGVANNWNPDSVPTATDQAVFNINDAYTVTFGADHPSLGLQVLAGNVSFESSSATARDYTVGGVGLTVRGATLDIGAVGAPVDLATTGPALVGDSTANGTVTVAGVGSALDAAVVLIGSNGVDGTLTYQSGATGTLGAAGIGAIGVDDSDGVLEVLTDADLTTANLGVATETSTSTGLVAVDGSGSTLMQTGTSILSVGSASGGAGTINVTNNGTFNSGTGAITVNATGAINVGTGATGGTFNANSDMAIDGAVNLIDGQMNAGTITLNGNGAFNFTGGVLVVDSFVGDLTQDGGTLAPRRLARHDRHRGAYDLNAGTLAIEIGGLTPGTDFDQVNADTINIGAGTTLDVVADQRFHADAR